MKPMAAIALSLCSLFAVSPAWATITVTRMSVVVVLLPLTPGMKMSWLAALGSKPISEPLLMAG